MAHGRDVPGPGTPGSEDASSLKAESGSAPYRFLKFDELGTALALIFLVVGIGLLRPDFLQVDALLNTLRTAAYVAIVAYGMVFLLAMTEIDLSVGGIYAVSIVAAAQLMSSVNPYIAALLAIGLAAAMGLMNGVLAQLFRIPVIIVTLGTLSLYRGLVTIISDGMPIADIPVESSFFVRFGGDLLGVPVVVWVVFLTGCVMTVVFNRTRFGAAVRAVGSNREAARFSGIPVGRVRLWALGLVGGLAGLSGVLSLAYFQGADPTVGVGFELQVIAAAIIGGTAVSGGSGTVPGALLGALIVAVINTGLVFFAVSTNWTNFVTGAVILVAVGTDALVRNRRARRAFA
ncbi:ABC transporter permease [Nocardioides sp. 1609]|uniref:ABC transporter permease n=1 Tax=Nocardioides sp. 1609 TaxID=2508327 RepID=UPI0014310400|nr:ABC transporter permease [Nocardioides sp. 1609]